MRLYGVTTTYNNEKIVPYVMKYLSELDYDKLIVLDNGSTDKTVEMLKEYPFVEVREWLTDIFNETERMNVMADALSEMAGQSRDDVTWGTMNDFDEVFYYAQQDKDKLKDVLIKITNAGFNVCTEHFVNLISDGRPLREDEFLHFQVEKCAYSSPFDWCKPVLFRLDNLVSVYHTIGHHYANFEFYDAPVKQLYNTKYLHAFHLKFAFGKEHLINTIRGYNKRKYYYGDVVVDKYQPIEYASRYFDRTYANGIRTEAYLEHKMLCGDDSWEHNDNLVHREF